MRFSQGRLAVFGGTNRMSGAYALVGYSVIMGQLVSTKMAGPPALMEPEGRFARALASVDGFRVQGDEMALSRNGNVIATFRSED